MAAPAGEGGATATALRAESRTPPSALMEGPGLPRQGGAHSDTGPGGAGWRGWAGRWLLSSAAPAPLSTPRPTWRTLNLDWPPLSANPSATAIPTLHRAGARAQRRPGESARSAGTGARARERGRARRGRAAGTAGGGHGWAAGTGHGWRRRQQLPATPVSRGGGGRGRRARCSARGRGRSARRRAGCAGEGALRTSGGVGRFDWPRAPPQPPAVKAAMPLPVSRLTTGNPRKRSGAEQESAGTELPGRSGAGWAPGRRTGCPECGAYPDPRERQPRHPVRGPQPAQQPQRRPAQGFGCGAGTRLRGSPGRGSAPRLRTRPAASSSGPCPRRPAAPPPPQQHLPAGLGPSLHLGTRFAFALNEGETQASP